MLLSTWSNLTKDNFEKSLHDGFLTRSKINNIIKPTVINQIKMNKSNYNKNAIDISIYEDYKVYDGRFSNNGWLQELPDPIHKLTWGNAASIAPKTAKKLNLKSGDTVVINANNSKLEIPVLIAPGQAANTLVFQWAIVKNLVLKYRQLWKKYIQLQDKELSLSIEGVTLIKTMQNKHQLKITDLWRSSSCTLRCFRV